MDEHRKNNLSGGDAKNFLTHSSLRNRDTQMIVRAAIWCRLFVRLNTYRSKSFFGIEEIDHASQNREEDDAGAAGTGNQREAADRSGIRTGQGYPQ